MSSSDFELQAWKTAADHWVRNAARIADMTRGASDALIARLAPEAGQRLLDVAAGVGDPALRLARLVGPTGHVTATDGVAEMLECLGERAREQQLHQVTTVNMPAEELEFPGASFDGACSRFGAMFFADPRRALSRMRRCVRPRGRLVLAVWGDRAANPFFTVTMDALDDVGCPILSLPPGSRSVFEFAEHGALAAVARSAGWHELHEEQVDFDIQLAETRPEIALEVLAELSRKITERLTQLGPEQRAAAVALVAQRCARYVRGRDLVFPARVLLVSGTA